MHHAQLLERVREMVRSQFAQLGVQCFDDFCETILVRDGFYCGRCFTCGDHKAVWFIEEQVIKFSCRQTGLVLSSPVCADGTFTRMAA